VPPGVHLEKGGGGGEEEEEEEEGKEVCVLTLCDDGLVEDEEHMAHLVRQRDLKRGRKDREKKEREGGCATVLGVVTDGGGSEELEEFAGTYSIQNAAALLIGLHEAR